MDRLKKKTRLKIEMSTKSPETAAPLRGGRAWRLGLGLWGGGGWGDKRAKGQTQASVNVDQTCLASDVIRHRISNQERETANSLRYKRRTDGERERGRERGRNGVLPSKLKTTT
jgi:hypothetical protein